MVSSEHGQHRDRWVRRWLRPDDARRRPAPRDRGRAAPRDARRPRTRPRFAGEPDLAARRRCPRATIRPLRSTATRSAARWISLRTCDERNTVDPAARASRDHAQELVLHQRVEPARGLVEDQQVRSSEEREQQGDLAAIAGGQLARGSIQVDLQALRDRGGPIVIQSAPEPIDGRHELAGRQAFGQPELARDIPDPAANRDTVPARVEPEDLDGAARSAGSGRAGTGSWSSCRRRWARRSRTPRRRAPVGRCP